MKKYVSLLILMTAFALTGLSQTTTDRPLSPSELRNEPWYYEMDSALANPDKVYKLSLTQQKLKEIPVEIAQLKNLQILNLSENKIKMVPVEIAELEKLQMLSLYKNKIRYIPDEFQKLKNLQALYLGANKVTEVPIWMGGMGKLKRLDVSRNPISPYELIYIRRLMPKADVTY